MLSPAADPRAADWVTAGVRDFDHTVGSVVPAMFEAYARVFHPASRAVGGETVPVPWADVAAANGRVMHEAAEWGSIVGTWKDEQGSSQPGVWDQPPRTGELARGVAARLAEVLAGYTSDPEHCCFAIWDGYGDLGFLFMFREGTPESVRRHAETTAETRAETWRALVEEAASFELPGREMSLLDGPLAAVVDFYQPHRNPPSMWWPGDHAWCVGTDIDLMSTYIGAGRACVQALLADDELEAWPVSVDQRVTWDADEINPLPEPP
jgi:hypothetical protein